MPATKVKQEAQKLIDRLPEDATWEALMRAIYERMQIEGGLRAAEAGNVTDARDIRREFGLDA